jgi:hypothetical protein
VAEPVALAAVQEPRRRTETYSSQFLVPRSGFVFAVPVPGSEFKVRRSLSRTTNPEPGSSNGNREHEPGTRNLEPRTGTANTNPEHGTWNVELQCFKLWRKRLGVEPNLPAERGATGFEDREGHRAPFASVCR